jgi:hypothetical protein
MRLIRERLSRAERLNSSLIKSITAAPWATGRSLINLALSRSGLRKGFLSDPFPSAAAELAKSPVFRRVSSVESEHRLALLLLAEYSPQVQEFLGAAQTFERSLLTASYSEARAARDLILTRFGFSLWTIETGFLVGELEHGVKGNREALLAIQESITNTYVNVLLAFWTQRIEAAVTVTGYEGSLNSLFEDLPPNPSFAPINAETTFRLNFPKFTALPFLNNILMFAREYSIVDVYETLVRALVSQYRDDFDPTTRPVLAVSARRAAELSDDPRMHNLSSIVGREAPLLKDTLAISLLKIAHDYTVGDYSSVLASAPELLRGFPECFELYEFIARSALQDNSDLPTPFPQRSLGAVILETTHAILARAPGIASASANLLKVGYALDSLSIGHRIVAFCLDQSKAAYPQGVNALRVATATRVTPWAAVRAPRPVRTFLIQKLTTAYPTNLAVALHARPSRVPSDIPLLRRLQFEADSLEQAGQYDASRAAFAQLRDQCSGRLDLLQRATAGLIRCSLHRLDHAAAAAHIVDAFLVADSLLWGELSTYIGPLIQHMQTAPEAVANVPPVTWALLLHIGFSLNHIEQDYYQLFVAYDNHLLSQGARRPTDLFVDQPTRHVLGFLRWVCTREVMHFSHRIRSAVDMEGERVRILQYLLQHDPVGRSVYDDEIAALTETSMLRDAVQHVESSLIYVNGDGIRRSLADAHEQRFRRFVAIIGLEDAHLRRQLQLKGFTYDKAVTFADLGFTLFTQLLGSVKDAFVGSKADGLDTYLSMRIRHGTLSGKLRGAFEQLHLVTRRTTVGGEYTANEYWSQRFKEFGAGVGERVDMALRRFSAEVDDLIAEVNDRWIRVRGAQYPEGMFDFSFSDGEIGVLYLRRTVKDTSEADYREFVDECFDDLWRRTEDLLTAIRSRITGELRFRLTDALARAENAILPAFPYLSSTDLGVQLTSARTTIQRDTQVVAQWFAMPSHLAMPPFSFSLLVRTAAEMVRRMHPGLDFVADIDEGGGFEFRGDVFTHLCAMYSILFNNVVRHSGLTAFGATASLVRSGDQLAFEVANELAPDVDHGVLSLSIERANALMGRATEDLRLQTEGKSGFEKLHSILRNDLRRADYSLHVALSSTGRFVVALRCEGQGLRLGDR